MYTGATWPEDKHTNGRRFLPVGMQLDATGGAAAVVIGSECLWSGRAKCGPAALAGAAAGTGLLEPATAAAADWCGACDLPMTISRSPSSVSV